MAARGRCPRCGNGPLFAGYLKVAACCPSCRLDYARVDTGDGPAFFVILLVGLIVVPPVLVVEVALTPPYWLHALLWLPVTTGLVLTLLRPFKGLLIGAQYVNEIGEERSDDSV